MRRRRRGRRAQLGAGDARRTLRAAGVDVCMGRGDFIGADEIEVGGRGGERRRLRFRRAVVATGASPSPWG